MTMSCNTPDAVANWLEAFSKLPHPPIPSLTSRFWCRQHTWTVETNYRSSIRQSSHAYLRHCLALHNTHNIMQLFSDFTLCIIYNHLKVYSYMATATYMRWYVKPLKTHITSSTVITGSLEIIYKHKVLLSYSKALTSSVVAFIRSWISCNSMLSISSPIAVVVWLLARCNRHSASLITKLKSDS